MTSALLIVVCAGLSEAIGQSVVLFANRVPPARFVASVFTNGLLIAAGFASLVLFTWLSFFIPGARPVSPADLTVAVGSSYAPLLLGFLSALPYAGNALLWALRVAQLVAMVGAVAEVADITVWMSAGHVALGWGAKLALRQTFDKPFAAAQRYLMNLAAGKTLVAERAAVRRAARRLLQPAPTSADRGAPAVTHPHGQSIFAATIVTVLSVAAILVALSPLRVAVAHTFTSLIVLRAGFDAFWIVLAAVVIAAFLAPLETLGWWAGWYGDDVDPAHPAVRSAAGTSDAVPAVPARYLVYLDGISQSSATYTPDVEAFLDALEPELPPGMVLIRGIMAYSVLNRPLDDDPMYARFWHWVERLRGRARTAIVGMFINIRNVMIVAVSADSRYGPLYNLGIAQVVYNELVRRGYRPHSGVPITMMGYSGGGQMCAETAPMLRRALGAHVDVISLAGVMTGTCRYQDIHRLHHMYGSKDIIEPLGPIMFASRWPVMRQSNWNRGRRNGRIKIMHLGPVGHQVPGGLLDPAYALPDGTPALRRTLDEIKRILAER